MLQQFSHFPLNYIIVVREFSVLRDVIYQPYVMQVEEIVAGFFRFGESSSGHIGMMID